MEVEFLSQNKKQNRITFLVKGTTPAFVNLLRKTILDEVPTMAIEDVEMRKNSSVIYDEMISHRLGLIPLTTDLSAYNLPEECTCKGEGCSKCTLQLSLKGKGPGYVYASDLKSNDPKVVPVYPKTPIVKLIKGQALEFEATAVLGKGMVHAKWNPALAYYRSKPEIEVKKGSAKSKEVSESCPAGIFTAKNKELALNKDKELDCTLCGACVDVDGEHVKLNESQTDFIFTVESFGQLAPKDIVATAIGLMDKKCDEVIKLVGK